MALSDIADGLTTTQRQREHGVAVVDRTDRSLSDALAAFESAIPVDAATAATMVSAYAGGASVGDAAIEADVAPITASKTLHRLGFEGLSPLSPLARDICRDWLTADISRADALELTQATETELALAAYIETHEPLDGASETIRDALSTGADAMVEKRDALAETMTASQDLL